MKMEKQINKIRSAKEAGQLIKSGMTIMVGGFGGVGNPPTLIDEMLKNDVSSLTVICNDAGFPHVGVGRLVTDRRVDTLIASHIGSNPNAGQQMTDGELQIEFSPQGT